MHRCVWLGPPLGVKQCLKRPCILVTIQVIPLRDLPEAFFERALAVARQQQAKSWELRAAVTMARLRRNQGQHTGKALDLLAPVYSWFTAGFLPLDLKEAKGLLDELTKLA
jgi:hypothetical protein